MFRMRMHVFGVYLVLWGTGCEKKRKERGDVVERPVLILNSSLEHETKRKRKENDQNLFMQVDHIQMNVASTHVLLHCFLTSVSHDRPNVKPCLAITITSDNSL